MRILQHTLGLWSVAFAPDGTLFVLTQRGGALWAHPAGELARVLVAVDGRLSGNLEVSPDGRWLAVSGGRQATVFRVGPLTPPADGPTAPAPGLGWERHTFPDTRFYQPGHFTGDSAGWVGRADVPGRYAVHHFRRWRLPDFAPFDHPPASALPCLEWATTPVTSHAVVAGWSSDLNAVGAWRVDVARPDTQPELLGTVEDCANLVVGSDGRLFASDPDGLVRIYSPRAGKLRLDQTVSFPKYESSPHVVVSADGRRLVARAFRNKLVYAGDTTTGEVFGPWDWKIGQVNGVAIAPDGLTAAAAGSNKKVAVWDLE